MQDGVCLALLQFLQQATRFQCGLSNDLDTRQQARHNNISAPSDLPKIENYQLSPAYAADCHEMLATSAA
jgi:hypothetical protein